MLRYPLLHTTFIQVTVWRTFKYQVVVSLPYWQKVRPTIWNSRQQPLRQCWLQGGDSEGSREGASDGNTEGASEGSREGASDGAIEGAIKEVRTADGTREEVGLADGEREEVGIGDGTREPVEVASVPRMRGNRSNR